MRGGRYISIAAISLSLFGNPVFSQEAELEGPSARVENPGSGYKLRHLGEFLGINQEHRGKVEYASPRGEDLEPAPLYKCPMGFYTVSKSPGNCNHCGMVLENDGLVIDFYVDGEREQKYFTYEKVIDDLTRRVKEDPNDPVLRLHLGAVYSAMNSPRAVFELLKAKSEALNIGLSEVVGEVYNRLGSFYQKRGMFAKSRSVLEEGVREAPTPSIFYSLGNNYISTGNFDEAEGIYLKGMDIFENDEEAMGLFETRLDSLYKMRSARIKHRDKKLDRAKKHKPAQQDRSGNMPDKKDENRAGLYNRDSGIGLNPWYVPIIVIGGEDSPYGFDRRLGESIRERELTLFEEELRHQRRSRSRVFPPWRSRELDKRDRMRTEIEYSRINRRIAEGDIRKFRNSLNTQTFAWERDHHGQDLPEWVRERQRQLKRMERDFSRKYRHPP